MTIAPTKRAAARLTALVCSLGLGISAAAQTQPSAPAGGLSAEWMAALEAVKDPWFWYSTGAGYTHTDRAWMDDMRLPMTALKGYVQRLEDGDSIDRPLEQVLAERDRITSEYSELIADAAQQQAFTGLVQLARTVYPYVENHNFYVEHWH
ncbi:MAG: PEP-utilizing protein mobile subunit, partial [Betaproteobacteria bacterium]|nr:PEP-utilizing protein mobile subunit [Betaproteobacteria bacterium]